MKDSLIVIDDLLAELSVQPRVHWPGSWMDIYQQSLSCPANNTDMNAKISLQPSSGRKQNIDERIKLSYINAG